MKRVGLVTVGRSDYSIYLPVLRRLEAEPGLDLKIIAAGMHLSPEFGSTVEAIEADGFQVAERVEALLSSDTPEGLAKSVGLGVIGFAQLFGRFRPDILVVLGDRFEMYAAAIAALPFNLPVAHIHGGELTQGAIDDSLRHSMTKLAHLHFVSTEEYARRVIQLGEEPWRVTVSGAPALDNLKTIELLGPEELSSRFGLDLSEPPLLVTYHPVTLEYQDTARQAAQLLAALEAAGQPVIFTLPNADTAGRTVRTAIEDFCGRYSKAGYAANLGTQGYYSLMALATAMVGNSSSGVIEAPSFELPVVNVGARQQGRLRAANVIDVGYGTDEILAGIEAAVSPDFRGGLKGLINPYGDGQAAEKIVSRIKDLPPAAVLLTKRFHDIS